MLESLVDLALTLTNVGIAAVFEYISLHVLFCLIPAFFLAGAIAALFSKESVLKFLGPDANKVVSYGVAAVSGVLLAVCSCTVLPLFTGIYKRGAGIGPATAFLFSAPAINVLAIVYSAQQLGYDIGIARAFFAVTLSVVIGAIMAILFQKKLTEELKGQKKMPFVMTSQDGGTESFKYRTPLTFLLLVVILVFGGWTIDWLIKGPVLAALIAATAYTSYKWYSTDELSAWMNETWFLVKKIFPLLIAGVFFAAIIIYLIPTSYIQAFVGGDSLSSIGIASVSAAFMYFSTLTEVPIVGLLMAEGMGKGPALAMLLAGPALSLPSMIVITSIMGKKRGLTYIGLIILMAVICGVIFAAII
ncbi:permease [Methanocella sp. MCL-LM]|uniref:permease n=1 Tax=Methanocella sp. MCL-LM TaxID=3412035 RepID=UPI003C7730C8